MIQRVSIVLELYVLLYNGEKKTKFKHGPLRNEIIEKQVWNYAENKVLHIRIYVLNVALIGKKR
jgi:hypothetical protein